MSIFLEIAKRTLEILFLKAKKQSHDADHSLKNQAMEWIKLGRDRDLSESKQALYGELIKRLQTIKSQEGGDKANEHHLINLLNDYRKKAYLKSTEKHYDEGEFGKNMQKAVFFVKSFFEKMLLLELANLPYDEDPLHIFYYHIAEYFAQKFSTKENFALRLMHNPKLSNARELEEQKEKLVLLAMKELQHDLEAFDKNHVGYEKVKRKFIVDTLKNLVEKKIKALDENSFFSKRMQGLFFSDKKSIERCIHLSIGHIDAVNNEEGPIVIVEDLPAYRSRQLEEEDVFSPKRPSFLSMDKILVHKHFSFKKGAPLSQGGTSLSEQVEPEDKRRFSI